MLGNHPSGWAWSEDRYPSHSPMMKSWGGLVHYWTLDVWSQDSGAGRHLMGTVVLSGSVDGELKISLVVTSPV